MTVQIFALSSLDLQILIVVSVSRLHRIVGDKLEVKTPIPCLRIESIPQMGYGRWYACSFLFCTKNLAVKDLALTDAIRNACAAPQIWDFRQNNILSAVPEFCVDVLNQSRAKLRPPQADAECPSAKHTIENVPPPGYVQAISFLTALKLSARIL